MQVQKHVPPVNELLHVMRKGGGNSVSRRSPLPVQTAVLVRPARMWPNSSGPSSAADSLSNRPSWTPAPRCQLHDDALGAAASLLLAAVHVHLFGGAVRARVAAAAGGVALHLAVVSSDLSYNVVEGPLDIETGLGRGLDELAAERACKSLSLCKNGAMLARTIHANKVGRIGWR